MLDANRKGLGAVSATNEHFSYGDMMAKSLREWFWFLLSFSAFFWPLGWPFWGNVLLALFIAWFGTLDDEGWD